jgi:hypothetical protein
MKVRKISLVAAVLVAIFLFVTSVSYIRLTLAAREEAGEGVSAISYYEYGILPNTIVYDIWGVGPNSSQAGILGGFFRFSDRLKDRTFTKVILSYRGTPRFVLGGDDFHTIGQEFEFQNPIFTLRTLPEKLKTPDGMQAFDSWSGGMLGVLNAQMEDVNEMGRRWYLNDLLR